MTQDKIEVQSTVTEYLTDQEDNYSTSWLETVMSDKSPCLAPSPCNIVL